jgi:hypothetical protein
MERDIGLLGMSLSSQCGERLVSWSTTTNLFVVKGINLSAWITSWRKFRVTHLMQASYTDIFIWWREHLQNEFTKGARKRHVATWWWRNVKQFSRRKFTALFSPGGMIFTSSLWGIITDLQLQYRADIWNALFNDSFCCQVWCEKYVYPNVSSCDKMHAIPQEM